MKSIKQISSIPENGMTDKQLEFGKNLLRQVAKNWDVSEEKAARILMSEEFKFRPFFNWVHAEEFLFRVIEKYETLRRRYGC